VRLDILRLSKRALQIVVSTVLGFTIAFSLPLVSRRTTATLSQPSTLIQKLNWEQANQPSAFNYISKIVSMQSLPIISVLPVPIFLRANLL
jgi:hypothetical protein